MKIQKEKNDTGSEAASQPYSQIHRQTETETEIKLLKERWEDTETQA
jgi:hypothetical protein